MRAHPPPLSHPRTATRTPANCLPGTSHKAVERCSRWRESTAVLAVDPPRRPTVAQLFLYLDAATANCGEQIHGWEGVEGTVALKPDRLRELVSQEAACAASGYRWDYIEAEHKPPPKHPKRPFIPSQNPPPVWRAVDRQAVLGSVTPPIAKRGEAKRGDAERGMAGGVLDVRRR